MVGGVDTALRHSDSSAFKKRLFHVKGKRNCRVRQVDLSVQSLNQGDVFILDAGSTIFVWNGPQSNVGERIKVVLNDYYVRNLCKTFFRALKLLVKFEMKSEAGGRKLN